MKPAKNTENHLEALQKYLASQGFKRTHQRDLLIKLFFAPPHRHFRIEELLDQSRKIDPTISYATVYRTLNIFVTAGFAHQRQFGKGQSLFEPVSGHHHDHLICNSCGRIIEFENQTIEKLQESIVKKHGFKLTHHKMELYGICSDCQKKT